LFPYTTLCRSGGVHRGLLAWNDTPDVGVTLLEREAGQLADVVRAVWPLDHRSRHRISGDLGARRKPEERRSQRTPGRQHRNRSERALVRGPHDGVAPGIGDEVTLALPNQSGGIAVD